MRLDRIDLNLFLIFDALYRERNVTRVSQQLNLTQPAVSNALGRLRQSLNDALFVRTPEGMAPTPVADSMIDDVRRALELLHRSAGATATFDPATAQRVFRIGMNDMAEALLLPALHSVLAVQAPGIGISTTSIPREESAQELKAGTVDLLLEVMVPGAKELGVEALASFPYVLAMRRGHPLARRRVGLEEYLGHRHVNVSSRPRGRGHVDIALNRLGRQRRVAMRVQSYLVAAKLTSETDLLWSVPGVLAQALPLRTVALPFEVAPLEWNLYWARSAQDDPANRWMRSQLQQAAHELIVSASSPG